MEKDIFSMCEEEFAAISSLNQQKDAKIMPSTPRGKIRGDAPETPRGAKLKKNQEEEKGIDLV